MRVASFDIGKKNFAFYVEEFDRDALMSLKTIPEHEQYNPDGTPTPKMQKILDAVCMNGKTILHKNIDLTFETETSKGRRLDPQTFYNMTSELDKYISYWDTCSAFVIERQMEFAGKALNIPAVKLGQHCFSYFTFLYSQHGIPHTEAKQVIEFSAQHKGQVLGTPKMINEKKPVFKNGRTNWCAQPKPKRKKFAVKQCIELLTKRGEGNVLQGIKTAGKKDDLADTFLQLQAFKYLAFVKKEV